MVPDQSPCKNSHTPAPPSVGFSHAKHCSQEVLRCRLRMSDNLESQVQAIMQASLDKQNRLLPSPQINETFSLIFASLAVAEISLTTSLPAEASNIECSELAKHFADAEVNFDEKIVCRTGPNKMTYGSYCSRTQGIVCTKGRGLH